MHITLSYLYRDAGNYKQFNEEVFTNEKNLQIDYIEQQIKKCLYDETWFYVDRWGMKDLHVHPWDNELDHTWHEFESVADTNEKPTTAIDISDLLSKILAIKL